MKDFKNRNNSITYRSQDKTGFSANVTTDASDKSPIESLMVATKTHHTLKALEPTASRLTPKSNILLMQNGMGVAEELLKHLWPNTIPPNIFVGVNRHAVERMAPYDVHQHSGYNDPDALQNHRYSETSGSCIALGEDQSQDLQKRLFINACINRIASVLMTKNIGVIKGGNPGGIAMMRAICEEDYQVFEDEIPGETMDSLMDMVLRTNQEAGQNVSSTIHDIRAKIDRE
ncbi:hypothetical protein [Parasitella parasitica]|uniref:2-dehydropantoate 2-reductase n=1 Tax=Parasitella parasitica TaxID=35722 RepID=A0A0B7NBH8_9FUNG|nr:hypothetical protein [Parasitella parasitica]